MDSSALALWSTTWLQGGPREESEKQAGDGKKEDGGRGIRGLEQETESQEELQKAVQKDGSYHSGSLLCALLLVSCSLTWFYFRWCWEL